MTLNLPMLAELRSHYARATRPMDWVFTDCVGHVLAAMLKRRSYPYDGPELITLALGVEHDTALKLFFMNNGGGGDTMNKFSVLPLRQQRRIVLAMLDHLRDTGQVKFELPFVDTGAQ